MLNLAAYSKREEPMIRLSLKNRMLLGVATVVLLALPATAQYTTASLGGTVMDASGAAIPDAKVTVRNTETGFTQTVNASAVGAFLFPRLPIGSYELRAEKDG